MLRSVRARILASILAVTAAGMAVAGTTAYVIQRERTLETVDERLRSIVDETAFVAGDSAPATLNDAITEIVQRVRPGSDETAFAVVDGSTAVIPGGTIDFHLEDDGAFVARMVDETAAGDAVRGTALTPGRAVRYVAIPVRVTGDAASGVFVTAVDLDARLRPLDEAFRTFTAVALAALALVALVGWFVAGRLLAPIRTLRDTAARITASDVSERIPVSGNDDVSELTGTVNGMLDRLEGALTGQRQLLDDVGHELRTPVTIVRGHLELMDAGDPVEVEATRVLAIDELDRMSGLVDDISALAVMQRPLSLTLQPVDVAALTESVRAKASALSTDHTWITGKAATVIALADPERLTQALLQLAANAVAHGAPSGIIEISSAAADGRLRMWVRDDGPGIPQAAQERVFERFGRATVGRGSRGSGLGLAIVSAIAAAHGGRAAVSSVEGAGSTFVIDIPLREETA